MTDKPEIYVMVDIEASGPIPGDYSMLSLGAAVVGQHQPPFSKSYYVELKPIPGANVQQEAMDVNKLSIQHLLFQGQDPRMAMTNFREWVCHVANPEVMRPVMVSMGTFDHMFVTWYFHHYGVRSPFPVNNCDVKSFYFGRFKKAKWSQTTSKNIAVDMPKNLLPKTHHALDDALHQAEYFHRMLQL